MNASRDAEMRPFGFTCVYSDGRPPTLYMNIYTESDTHHHSGTGRGPDAHSQGERHTMRTNTTGTKGRGRRAHNAIISVFAITLLVASSLFIFTSETKDIDIEDFGDIDESVFDSILGAPGSTEIVATASGLYHTLALRSDGTVWACGYNDAGQLGDGTRTTRGSPVQVRDSAGTGYLRNITAIAAGENASFALTVDGEVWAWGQNAFGMLGNNSTTNSSTPVHVLGGTSGSTILTGIKAISSQNHHVLALKSDGTVWAWGDNSKGQIGTGSTTTAQYSTPVQVRYTNGTSYMSDITAIAAGSDHSLALEDTGKVLAWGAGNEGQLGNNNSWGSIYTPVYVRNGPPGTYLNGVTAIAAGYNHSLAVRATGSVYAWGGNGAGQLGNNETSNRSMPVQVLGGASGSTYLWNVTAVAAGKYCSVALTAGGAVYSWGYNNDGQLGDGTNNDRKTPVRVLSGTGGLMSGVTAISTSEFTGMALKSDGTVWAWGLNAYNKTAATYPGSTSTELHIPALTQYNRGTNITAIAAGHYHTLALRADGTVWACGKNFNGQLGDGTTVDKRTPVMVSGLTDVVAIAAGYYHSLAIKSNGEVWAWGRNYEGQLGDGSGTVYKTTPVRAMSGNATAIAAGKYFSLALTADGNVMSWGLNDCGQLGDYVVSQRNTPGFVYENTLGIPLSWIVAIAAGSSHSLALTEDGRVYSWGANNSGQLGIGNTASRSRAGMISDFDGVTAIAAGYEHSLALKCTGSVYGWGFNYHGQVGDGTTALRLAPVFVTTGITAIAAGATNSLAIDSTGFVYAWGTPRGDNDAANTYRPVRVLRGESTGTTYLDGVKAVAGGFGHSLALRSNGTVYGWGSNWEGQLSRENNSYGAPVRLLFDQVNPVPGNSGTVSVTNVTSSSLTLNWTKASDNQSPQGTLRYYVYQKQGASGTYGDPLNPGGTLDISSRNVTGLAPNTLYYFRVVVADQDGNTAMYQEISRTTNKPALTGTVTINNTSPRVGDTLTLSVAGSNATGTMTYEWNSTLFDGIGGASTYTVQESDLGEQIRVFVYTTDQAGQIDSAYTAPVAKRLGPAAPAAPTVLSKTHNSVTLTATAGYQYSRDGSTWQNSNVFGGLSANTAYSFYQRIAETPSTLPSASSNNLSVTTDPLPTGALTGTATITPSTAPRIDDTLNASLVGGNNTGTLSYQWKADGANIGTAPSYVVKAGDLNKRITVDITSTVETGTVTSATTSPVAKKAGPAAPVAPNVSSFTHDTVTLTPVAGCEYSMDGSTWRTSNVFGGLSAGTAYTFYQRIAETSDTSPSPASLARSVTTAAAPPGALTGTAIISNMTPKIGDTLNASIDSGNAAGTLSYQWKANGANVGTEPSYVVKVGDLDKEIMVEITSAGQTGKLESAQTAAVAKKTAATPAAPNVASSTYKSVTLTAIAGYEYSMDGGTWQTSNVFDWLLPNTTYSFTQRAAETDDTLRSAASPARDVTTPAAPPGVLVGTATIDNTAPKIGDTLSASIVGGNASGTLSYQWKADGAPIAGATGVSYIVTVADLDKGISVEIASSGQTETLTSRPTFAVAKKDGPAAPAAPTLSSKTHSSVTLTPTAGYEYSMDGKTWQSENVFGELHADTPYTFYQRVAATADTFQSPASAELSVTTDETPTKSGEDGGGGGSNIVLIIAIVAVIAAAAGAGYYFFFIKKKP